MSNKQIIRYSLLLLLFLNSLSAIVSGLLLIIDPGGVSMGLSKDILASSPFDNFFIPGILLLIVNGLSGILVLWQVIKRSKAQAYWLIMQGLLSTGWIGIQVILLCSFNALHLVFGIIGILFLLAGISYLPKKIKAR